MKNIHLIKTAHNNHYLYNFNKERSFLIHPKLYSILLKNNNDLYIKEASYYQKKVSYLKKHQLLEGKVIKPEFQEVTPELVEKKLINTNQITFEVTDKCNLNCKYCGYGELYNDYDKRTGKDLDIEKAIKTINYLSKYWNSNKDISSHKIIDIGFYGGEPLLNMNFIKTIVKYAKGLENTNRVFTFSMTTNAMLLNKYMDFLVANKFRLLISLDGDRKANMNRPDRNGNIVFDRLIRNIDLLKENYPNYFEENVNFNAVLHDKNPIDDLYQFFKSKYNKIPRTSPLTDTRRKKEKNIVFKKMERNVLLESNQSKKGSKILSWMGITAPGYLSFVYFVYQCMGSVYTNYNELICDEKFINYFPSGTCLPFGKRIFITVNSKILPCERIGQNFILGYIKNDLEFNFTKISEMYNKYFNKIKQKCKSCYRYKNCTVCLLQTNGKCNFINENTFNNRMQYLIERLEKNPKEYKIIKTKLIIR